MIKVISFSIWGNNPKYLVGLKRNLELMRDIYPGWWSAIYWGGDIDRRDRFELTNQFDDLHKMSVIHQSADWRNMFHRFRVLEDLKDSDLFISRDCDSRLTEREAAAVNEWVESDSGFHTIHDHYHHTVPMLGGMWGMKRGAMPEFAEQLDDWVENCGNYWQVDQEFLTQRVWPVARHDVLNHTEFHGNLWPGVAIPMKRQGREFIGASYDENDIIDAEQLRQLYG